MVSVPLPAATPTDPVTSNGDRPADEVQRGALASRYEFRVTSTDRHGNALPEERFITDMALFRSSTYIESRTVHDVAQELRKIRTLLAGVIDVRTSRGFRVYTKDYEAMRAEFRDRTEEQRLLLDQADQKYPQGFPPAPEEREAPNKPSTRSTRPAAS